MRPLNIFLLLLQGILAQESIYYGSEHPVQIRKRDTDGAFKGHPKTREEKWHLAFGGTKAQFDQIPSLINLLHMLTTKYLEDCTPVVLYDSIVENNEGLLLQQLFKNFPSAYVHGRVNKENAIIDGRILNTITTKCVSYILFMEDVMKSADILGLQATAKIIVVARSSQWRVQEFLYDKACRSFVNLLVIAQSFRDDSTLETPYILYTHSLFVDGLGASKPMILTSWSKGKLARPSVDLFPPKMTKGYAGHRFSVVAANQPPFVFKISYRDFLGNPKVRWDGIEYRLLNLLGHRNNFSLEVKEPEDISIGSGDAVWKEIGSGHADIGIGGLYVTSDRLLNMDMSVSHSQDCASFISLTSTALPKYRAIMGPFHWTVWVALTITYLIGIFPLAFSDKHTLRHLIHNAGEVENMFWYVFGTFTNCFTFVGRNSWSKTTKITTRLLIGWYWIFTIIITSCYTGSIIAFVTLPVYPSTVDTVDELLAGHFRVGTLDRGGWNTWFANSSDANTNRLLKHLELVPDVESGLSNTTKAFFWSYAFLGSKFQLEHIVQSNFTLESSKRALLHISDKCFVPFGVSLGFPKQSVYAEKLNRGILMMLQSGIVSKLISDVKWKMQRSSTGKLLQVSTGNSLKFSSVEERGLSLSDTQGMFLLLAIGFVMATVALVTEWMGGCGRMCRRRRKVTSSTRSITSTVSTESVKSRIAPSLNSKPDKSDVDRSSDTSIRNLDEVKDVLVEQAGIVEILVETVAENNVKCHSRRSSYVDWDKEINEVFDAAVIEEVDVDTIEEKAVIEAPQNEEHKPETDLFGEVVSPI